LFQVLVTGGNSGIGFAMCKQLATEDDCHVYLGARSEERGSAAVKSILDAAPAAKVELVIIDVGSDESVAAAAAKLANVEFYGVFHAAKEAPQAAAVPRELPRH
jgi:NAD(P)-dependent dehydrogenase (short-subunit alcohol dehydrogenase family)